MAVNVELAGCYVLSGPDGIVALGDLDDIREAVGIEVRPQPRRSYTVREAHKITGVSQRTISDLIARKRLPGAFLLPGRERGWRLTDADLAVLLGRGMEAA